MAIDLSGVRALTFDCYGTLIDWESGITAALAPFLRGARGGAGAWTRERVLTVYAELERRGEAGAYRKYREVLREVLAKFGERAGFEVPPGCEDALAESIRDWPAFPDTAPSLARLQRKHRVGVLSNIDRDLFAQTAPRLGVELDALVTAEDVRSYKPARPHFEAGLRALGLRPAQVLHCAESRYHDVAPAQALGFQTCWVDRRKHEGAPSASGAGPAVPDLTVRSLQELVERMAGAG